MAVAFMNLFSRPCTLFFMFLIIKQFNKIIHLMKNCKRQIACYTQQNYRLWVIDFIPLTVDIDGQDITSRPLGIRQTNMCKALQRGFHFC